jgi:hypothetical protein
VRRARAFVVNGRAAFAAFSLLPASYYMTVDAVRVSDAGEGEALSILVQRTIHRDFAADWVATVRRMDPDGGVIAMCAASGRGDYRTTSKLPTRFTLDWWMAGAPCPLAPGDYVLTTRWTIDTQTPFDKVLSVTSNVFTIRPR